MVLVSVTRDRDTQAEENGFTFYVNDLNLAPSPKSQQ